MIHVVGHTNPDSDSICSALVAAKWLETSRGVEAVALAQGEVTGETAYILEQAGVTAPEICTSVAGKKVWLVDFSDKAQGPDDLDDAEIIGIVDHHRLGDITTVNPLEAWIWPVGCSCTILFNLHKLDDIEIDRAQAVLMLGAIVSDTVAFRSPTCTGKDRAAANELAQIADINLDDFCDQMMRVKTNLNGLSITSLVDRDLKKYPFEEAFLVIGQIEIASFEQVEDKIAALQAELKARCENDGLVLAALMVTNITTSTTRLLFQGEWSECLAEYATEANMLVMEDTLSRKKQAWPWMQTVLAG